MDLNALLQAAMQDPAARDFIGKMMGGAPAPQPQVNPMAAMARSIGQAGRSPLSGAQRAVQEQLVAFNPAQAAQPPMPPQMPPQGAPMPPPGMPMPQQGGMAPPAPPQGGAGGPPDLMQMLMMGR